MAEINMKTLIAAVITISVSVIILATVLAPQIATYTAAGGALADYKGLLSAVVIMSVVAILMVAVRLVTNSRDE